jgi:hypothetical protein
MGNPVSSRDLSEYAAGQIPDVVGDGRHGAALLRIIRKSLGRPPEASPECTSPSMEGAFR